MVRALRHADVVVWLVFPASGCVCSLPPTAGSPVRRARGCTVLTGSFINNRCTLELRPISLDDQTFVTWTADWETEPEVGVFWGGGDLVSRALEQRASPWKQFTNSRLSLGG